MYISEANFHRKHVKIVWIGEEATRNILLAPYVVVLLFQKGKRINSEGD